MHGVRNSSSKKEWSQESRLNRSKSDGGFVRAKDGSVMLNGWRVLAREYS